MLDQLTVQRYTSSMGREDQIEKLARDIAIGESILERKKADLAVLLGLEARGDAKEDIPALVKLVRQTHNLTQAGLAEFLGMSKSIVNHWEIGEKSPRRQPLDTMRRMLKNEWLEDEPELLEQARANNPDRRHRFTSAESRAVQKRRKPGSKPPEEG